MPCSLFDGKLEVQPPTVELCADSITKVKGLIINLVNRLLAEAKVACIIKSDPGMGIHRFGQGLRIGASVSGECVRVSAQPRAIQNEVGLLPPQEWWYVTLLLKGHAGVPRCCFVGKTNFVLEDLSKHVFSCWRVRCAACIEGCVVHARDAWRMVRVYCVLSVAVPVRKSATLRAVCAASDVRWFFLGLLMFLQCFTCFVLHGFKWSLIMFLSSSVSL